LRDFLIDWLIDFLMFACLFACLLAGYDIEGQGERAGREKDGRRDAQPQATAI
jgi:hypothetical protein